MKKILVGLFALVLCLSSFKGMAQETKIPLSVSLLGDSYVKDYVSLFKSIVLMRTDLSSNKGKFSSTKEMAEYVNSFLTKESDFGGCNDEQLKIATAAVENNNSSNAKIGDMQISDWGKSVLFDINNSTQQISADFDFSENLSTYSKKLQTAKVSDNEYKIVAYFILALEANYQLLLLDKPEGEVGYNSNSSDYVAYTYSNSNNSLFYNNEMQNEFLRNSPNKNGIQLINIESKGFWSMLKCAAGITGGAILGGLAGAAVGTVTLPLLGTVSGTIVGFYGGALAGGAASCG